MSFESVKITGVISLTSILVLFCAMIPKVVYSSKHNFKAYIYIYIFIFIYK
jgi:hypothetical protein